MVLTDPVPSTALDVLKKNLESLDEVVNQNFSTNRINNNVKCLSDIDRVTDDAPFDGWAYAMKDGVWQRYAQINYITSCGESFMQCGEPTAQCGEFDGYV